MYILLNIIIAIGRPGNMYPMISSVTTFNPICWLVMAWIMPTGMMYTKAWRDINKIFEKRKALFLPTIRARMKAQTGNCVGQTSIEMIPNTNITTNITMRKIDKMPLKVHLLKINPYHHSGT